jgi:hypothetical protein
MFNSDYSTINSNSKSSSKLLVPSDDGTKTIGAIINNIFTKSNFNSARHICFKYQAIGLDYAAFNNYILRYAKLIKCPDYSRGVTYTINTADYQDNGFIDNLGWGYQLFCPLKYWQIDRIPTINKQLNLLKEV